MGPAQVPWGERAAAVVGPDGHVIGVDVSRDMLALAQRRITALGLGNVNLLEGRAERIPAENAAFDVRARSSSYSLE